MIHFEKFMTEWEHVGERHEVLKDWTDIGLHWATQYYVRIDDTEAYVLAMCMLIGWCITAI